MAVLKQGRKTADRRMMLIGLVLLAAVVALRAFDPPLLKTLRLNVFDQFQRLSPRPYTPAPVRIVDIDDRSLARLAQWPWPRTLLAQLVSRLNELGAAAIAFDIVFAEPDRSSPRNVLERLTEYEVAPELKQHLAELPDHDQLFADAIAAAPVVLGFAGTYRAHERHPELLAGMAYAGTVPRRLLQEIPGAIVNLPVLEANASGQGSFALGEAGGGVMRRMPLLQNINGKVYPSLGLEALRVAQRASTIVVRASDASGEVRVGDAVNLQAIRVGQLEIPVTADGRIWMHYTGFVPERSVSAVDILNKPAVELKNLVNGQIVLIGTSAAGLKDQRATPVMDFQAGVSIHAQALEQILLGWHLERPGWAKGAELLALVLVGMLLLLLLSRVGPLWSAVVGLLAVSGGVAASWIAFTEYHMLIDPVYPSLSTLAVYLAVSSMGYLRAERGKRQVRNAFSSFLAPALVDQLVESPDKLRLGGESREMTFLFTDIAGFTSFTEASTPERLVTILNDYLDRMSEIVMDHGGTIDKIVGDAIHAIFNAPLNQSDHAARAVACALEMDKAGEEFVARHSTAELAAGKTRIGVNTGSAIVGNFGGNRRFDYTAHGDAINTAARLESVNKHLGTRVCVASSTADQCPDQAFRPIGELVLKGKTQEVVAYIPIAQAQAQEPLYESYCHFYERLRTGEPGLSEEVEALHQRFPDDPLIKLHFERLSRGETGVKIVMSEK